MRALDRTLVSVFTTFLTDSERSRNKKWLPPVTNKSNPPLVANQIEIQLKMFHFIYPHTETFIVILKIDSENIA